MENIITQLAMVSMMNQWNTIAKDNRFLAKKNWDDIKKLIAYCDMSFLSQKSPIWRKWREINKNNNFQIFSGWRRFNYVNWVFGGKVNKIAIVNAFTRAQICTHSAYNRTKKSGVRIRIPIQAIKLNDIEISGFLLIG